MVYIHFMGFIQTLYKKKRMLASFKRIRTIIAMIRHNDNDGVIVHVTKF